jgi:two-component system, NarL family, response regulator NreC
MLRYHSVTRHLGAPGAQQDPLAVGSIMAAMPIHEHRHVLIIDDHPPIREWVRLILTPHGFDVCEARSGEDALALVRQGVALDLAICDILMPHAQIEGIAAARALWYEHAVPCLILTSVQEAESRLAAAYAGAVGYVLKDAAQADLLLRSVQAVVNGQRPPELSTTLGVSDVEARQVAETQAAYTRSLELLTPQQRVVAALILEGKNKQEIAATLVLSRGTVNTHVSHILQRLNLETRREVKSRVLLHRAGRADTSVRQARKR